MKQVLVAYLFFAALPAHALVTIADEESSIDIASVLKPLQRDQAKRKQENTLRNLEARSEYPVKSKAKVGLLHKRSFKVHPVMQGQPLFIIGADEYSMTWLTSHRDFLLKKGAVGFVTNINSAEDLDKIQTEYGVVLTPCNVDDLMTVLKAENYPLYFDGEAIWQ